MNLNELRDLLPGERQVWLAEQEADDVIRELLAYLDLQERTRSYGRKSRIRKKLLIQYAEQVLGTDELQRIDDLAQEQADAD